ncbi:MAG: uracil-DNA glycosylase [Bacteroidota bacterium]
MLTIEQYIRRLARVPHTEDLENPYRGRSWAARLRRSNLELYFRQMHALHPTVLLLGEAPGYKGCGRTGIPFTSERTLGQEPFFRDSGYAVLGTLGQPQSEQSGDIVWGALTQWEKKPLIWNIYPFHPHRPGNRNSNRAPRAPELDAGRGHLENLLRLFPIQRIAAIGRKAESKLGELTLPYGYVRHPSYGGKSEFLAGLEAFRKG